ncbi:type I-E CRISPR-associated protein Cas5/CasD [Roseomonas sp. OT10]|uniref:type I-E CRISPR-associated protein Cas5/CasD n=1 Tax=Roseomonas cutis TaxID=2897332 RepID=UPI001E5794F1|nr:type I-E CRISPR-associated protein Cas5/CasD [Roseomonas sp. OT10]UFN49152.1 type I-E CRISPR-associated protein Cas5/CasD [Roseomonas sp. OT10]
MPAYLTFALVAPLASFGGIAVGERRGGWDRPARSAVLGLLGACLGVEREDDAAQAALAADYGLALLCHAPGRLLPDYHTAQMPPALRNRRFATRAEELAAPGLNTVLSRRDYRSGAWHLGALWARGEAPRWSLEQLRDAMARPTFVPYLGRKSCPLGLPLAPEIATADDPTAALERRRAEGPEARLLLPRAGRRETPLRDLLADQPADPLIVLDAADAGADPRLLRVEMRRDQPRSRRRWQFDLRPEAVLRGTAS